MSIERGAPFLVEKNLSTNWKSISNLMGCTLYIVTVTARTEAGAGASSEFPVYSNVQGILWIVASDFFLYFFLRKTSLLYETAFGSHLLNYADSERVSNVSMISRNSTSIEVVWWTPVTSGNCLVLYDLCLCVASDSNCVHFPFSENDTLLSRFNLNPCRI